MTNSSTQAKGEQNKVYKHIDAVCAQKQFQPWVILTTAAIY